MRLKQYILTENKTFKSGDWVGGIASTMLASEMVYGIFISQMTDELSLIATYQQKGKIKKKLYVQVYNLEKSTKDNDAPKDLLTFAKKHYSFGK